jgi:hypothetical protein
MNLISSSSIPPPQLTEVRHTFFSRHYHTRTASQSFRHTPKILGVSAHWTKRL